ncbi:MAG: hypothetical protein ACOY35_06530 [Bacillota bacterium]
MEKYFLPKNIFVSRHAAIRYLERIVHIPASSRKVYTARLFLTYILGNRALEVKSTRQDQSAFRLELVFRGVIVVYEPAKKYIYTIFPDDREREEKLELVMNIPADFAVSQELRAALSRKTRDKLFKEKWPVVGRRGESLILEVKEHKIEADLMKKRLNLPKKKRKGGAGGPAGNDARDQGTTRGLSPVPENSAAIVFY